MIAELVQVAPDIDRIGAAENVASIGRRTVCVGRIGEGINEAPFPRFAAKKGSSVFKSLCHGRGSDHDCCHGACCYGLNPISKVGFIEYLLFSRTTGSNLRLRNRSHPVNPLDCSGALHNKYQEKPRLKKNSQLLRVFFSYLPSSLRKMGLW